VSTTSPALSPARFRGSESGSMHRSCAIASKIKYPAPFLVPNLALRAASDTAFLFIFKHRSGEGGAIIWYLIVNFPTRLRRDAGRRAARRSERQAPAARRYRGHATVTRAARGAPAAGAEPRGGKAKRMAANRTRPARLPGAPASESIETGKEFQFKLFK